MNNNIDFNSLWKQQPVNPVPRADELINKAVGFKRKTRVKLIFSVVLLLLTAIFISWVIIHYKPVMLTTKIGALLIIAAIIMYVFASAPLITLLYRSDEQLNNQTYLQRLLLIKRKQKFLQTKTLSLYFVLLTLGLMLYMFEYAERMQLAGRILSYGITLAWIAFNWFYTRPVTIKKQQVKLNAIIEKLELVSSGGEAENW